MGQGITQIGVSSLGIMLRRGIEPVSLDKSTLFMGIPKDVGRFRRLPDFPLRATCVPDCTEGMPLGTFGPVVAQLKAKKVRTNNRIAKFLLNFILYLLYSIDR
jgi:hypothetical protein